MSQKSPEEIDFTFQSLLQWREKKDGIVFSEDEKDVALAVARAFFFSQTLLEELPERACPHTMPALSWSHGMNIVLARRSGRV
jgi:hypothetical protein